MVWRAGIDLNPLDVRKPDDVAWLEALIWPEQDFRRERLRQAIAVARTEPPLLIAGDLNEELHSLAGQAPSDAALVVFHSAVMAYLDAPDRETFRSTMARLAGDRGCHWLSNEGALSNHSAGRLQRRSGDGRRPAPGPVPAGAQRQSGSHRGAPRPESRVARGIYFLMQRPAETGLSSPDAWAATGRRSVIVIA